MRWDHPCSSTWACVHRSTAPDSQSACSHGCTGTPVPCQTWSTHRVPVPDPVCRMTVATACAWGGWHRDRPISPWVARPDLRVLVLPQGAVLWCACPPLYLGHSCGNRYAACDCQGIWLRTGGDAYPLHWYT